jgi:hypothetical protein
MKSWVKKILCSSSENSSPIRLVAFLIHLSFTLFVMIFSPVKVKKSPACGQGLLAGRACPYRDGFN